MTDQTPAAGAEVSLSPEVADYFGENQTKAEGKEKVSSTSKEDKKEASEGTTDEKKVEVKTEEKQTTEDKKDAKSSDEQKEEEKKDDKQKFLVAGKEYSSYDEAVKAVNSISGANSQLAGELKNANKQLSETSTTVEKLTKLLEDYKKANDAWVKYYEGDGDKPDEAKEDIEAKIEKLLEAKEKQREDKSKKEIYTQELDDIFKEEDIAIVLPVFKELVSEYGDSPKISPKKLYERARKLVSEDKSKDVKSFDDAVNERVRKELAKKEATKIDGTTGAKSTKEVTVDGLSPEVADYIKSIT